MWRPTNATKPCILRPNASAKHESPYRAPWKCYTLDTPPTTTTETTVGLNTSARSSAPTATGHRPAGSSTKAKPSVESLLPRGRPIPAHLRAGHRQRLTLQRARTHDPPRTHRHSRRHPDQYEPRPPGLGPVQCDP